MPAARLLSHPLTLNFVLLLSLLPLPFLLQARPVSGQVPLFESHSLETLHFPFRFFFSFFFLASAMLCRASFIRTIGRAKICQHQPHPALNLVYRRHLASLTLD
jgi:hypothetical protein